MSKEKIQDCVELPHDCPQCETVAETTSELQDNFGTRLVPQVQGRKGKRRIAQSWCRPCRQAERYIARQQA